MLEMNGVKAVGKDEKAQHKKERREGHKWLFIKREKKDTKKKLLNCRLRENEEEETVDNDDDVIVSRTSKEEKEIFNKRALCVILMDEIVCVCVSFLQF